MLEKYVLVHSRHVNGDCQDLVILHLGAIVLSLQTRAEFAHHALHSSNGLPDQALYRNSHFPVVRPAQSEAPFALVIVTGGSGGESKPHTTGVVSSKQLGQHKDLSQKPHKPYPPSF